jgi:hypothetical protein
MEQKDRLHVLECSVHKLRGVAGLIGAINKRGFELEERECLGLELIITDVCDEIEKAITQEDPQG